MATQVFVKDDLLIAADDGKIYHIPAETWKESQVSAYEAEWLKDELLSRGVVMAAIPETVAANSQPASSDDGGGALIACYLVNISGLRQQNPFENK